MKIGRYWGWIIAALAVTVLFFLSRIVFFLTEWLWYNANGYSQIFITIIKGRLASGISVGIIFFIFILINILLVKRFRTKMPLFLGNNVLQLPELNNIQPYIDRIAIAAALAVAVLSGYQASTVWELFLKALNGAPFGQTDPLYGNDISFYIFNLPLQQYLNSSAFILLLISLLLSLALYITSRSIYYTPREFRTSPKAKAHLLSLASLLILVKAWGYHIEIYELLQSSRGIVYGALYTDVYATLPYLKLAVVISVILAILVFGDMISRGWKFSLGSVVLLMLMSLAGGVIYPGIMQKFVVAPNELSKESAFIARNIEFTRRAFGLDSVVEREFSAREDLLQKDIEKNAATIKNVRLWDHQPLLKTYSELQEIRTYYTFNDVDNDRYTINGELRQTMLSPRELSYEKLPDKKWINQTFTYTHGYGCCLGPVNKVTEDGLPEFFIKDIPPSSSVDLKLERPEIYFGETTDTYCIVNSSEKEFDYPFGDKNVYCEYKGTGGMPVYSFVNRFLFAIRFHELKILLSTGIMPQSRIMFYRNINERLHRITPLVYYDPDPYMVISEGKLYWICDGYTISNHYPYSQPYPGLGNYIRNSVKAVIDAYNGTMKFYISDENDPIIKTYSHIFKGVFEPLSSMPSDIRAHLRYPAGMFYAQSLMYTTYHMTDPQVFYNKEDLWKIPKRMESKSEEDMKPYYTVLKFPAPEGEKEEFILMIPFTPAKKANMIAWMAARCDMPNYGKILVYAFPKDKLIYGPFQIEARINQDADISKQLTLWSQGGSEVIRGSLLVIPIEDSLLYIEPLYLAAEKGKMPQLKRVIVVYGRTVAMEQNLEEALKKVFPPTGGTGTLTKPDAPGRPGLPSKSRIVHLIEEASKHYEKARQCQRNDDWAGYGKEMNNLRSVLEELKRSSVEQVEPKDAPNNGIKDESDSESNVELKKELTGNPDKEPPIPVNILRKSAPLDIFRKPLPADTPEKNLPGKSD